MTRAAGVVEPGRERLRLNLWFVDPGDPQPLGGAASEVVIRDVVRLPEPGAAGRAAALLALAALARLRRAQR